MAERFLITGKQRDKIGRGEARRARSTGFIPAVLYGRGLNTMHLLLKEDEFYKTLHKVAGGNILIDLKIEGDASRPVIIKEIQQHPLSDQVQHVDLQVIRLDEVIKIKVPLTVKGESIGVKEGGILEFILREIEVECLPRDIPGKLEVNVSSLKIGDSIHLKDLNFPKGVAAVADQEAAVLSVVPPKVEKIAPAPEEAMTEPELIRREKGEEETSEEAEAKAPEGKAATPSAVPDKAEKEKK